MSAMQTSALAVLSTSIQERNLLANNSSKNKMTFIKMEDIPKILSQMNFPSKTDFTTRKFYSEIATDFVRNVFDLAMEHCEQRDSTNVEVKDVLRALKRYSCIPPSEWQTIKLNANHFSLRNRQNSIVKHRRRLQIAKKIRDNHERKAMQKKPKPRKHWRKTALKYSSK